jgi:excisionase family DNA binding protein
MPVDKLLYSVPETAEALNQSRSRTYEQIASGEIPSIKVGKLRRVPVDALKAWVKERLDGEAMPASRAPASRVGRKR